MKIIRKYIIIALLVIILNVSGCASKPQLELEPRVIVQKEYIDCELPFVFFEDRVMDFEDKTVIEAFDMIAREQNRLKGNLQSIKAYSCITIKK